MTHRGKQKCLSVLTHAILLLPSPQQGNVSKCQRHLSLPRLPPCFLLFDTWSRSQQRWKHCWSRHEVWSARSSTVSTRSATRRWTTEENISLLSPVSAARVAARALKSDAIPGWHRLEKHRLGPHGPQSEQPRAKGKKHPPVHRTELLHPEHTD